MTSSFTKELLENIIFTQHRNQFLDEIYLRLFNWFSSLVYNQLFADSVYEFSTVDTLFHEVKF